MNCLLVAATPKEIAPFMDHYRATLSLSADILIGGVGLAATTYHLTRQIHLKRPELIIQAGLGGCFDKQIPLASVITISEDVIADQSVIENKALLTMFDLGLADDNKLPYTKGWLKNKNTTLLKQTKLKQVRGISVNQITTSPQILTLYKNKFDPVVESMEGAALHYVCITENIPFLQLRSISNFAGERNKKNWNFKDAIENLNKELIDLITRITRTSKN